MDNVTTFTNPKTGEGSGATWTVREALAHALNTLNQDETITRCVILLGSVENDTHETVVINASKNTYEALGMLVDAQGIINAGQYQYE